MTRTLITHSCFDNAALSRLKNPERRKLRVLYKYGRIKPCSQETDPSAHLALVEHDIAINTMAVLEILSLQSLRFKHSSKYFNVVRHISLTYSRFQSSSGEKHFFPPPHLQSPTQCHKPICLKTPLPLLIMFFTICPPQYFDLPIFCLLNLPPPPLGFLCYKRNKLSS